MLANLLKQHTENSRFPQQNLSAYSKKIVCCMNSRNQLLSCGQVQATSAHQTVRIKQTKTLRPKPAQSRRLKCPMDGIKCMELSDSRWPKHSLMKRLHIRFVFHKLIKLC